MHFPAMRRENLVRTLSDDQVDAYLITSETNVRYLTGFTGDSSYLLITRNRAILVSDTRFTRQIVEECPGLETVIRGHDRTTSAAAMETLAKLGVCSVGVESIHMTISDLEYFRSNARTLEFRPIPGRVEELRALKDESEITAIRKAIRVAEHALGNFMETVKPTDTEKNIVDAMEYLVRRAGGNRTAFDVIAAVGERGALPHAPPTDRVLATGSKLLLDWGAEVDGYVSDLTRTFRNPYYDGPANFERDGYDFERMYDLVKRSHDAAAAVLRPGIRAQEVDFTARKVIEDAGFGPLFNHGLGHGIGLNVHERPRIRVNSDDILQPGHVITIEPGIYILEQPGRPGWGGIRIEDDYLITKDGAIRLSTLPHDPFAIES